MKGGSVRGRLTAFFLLVIGILLAVDVVFAFLHSNIIRRYQQVGHNIFLQFSLIGATEEAIARYNEYRNAPTSANLEAYEAEKEEIRRTFTELERSLTNPVTRDAFPGVRNTIESVIAETDEGIASVQAGDVSGTSERYAEAYRKLNFVRQNTSALILQEVEYDIGFEASVRRAEALMLVFAGILLAAALIVAMILSRVLSNRLVTPLSELTATAETVAAGGLDRDVNPALAVRNDELGSLARSFNTMLKALRDNVNVLKASNEEMRKAKITVDQKNAELERLNKFMVGRENKMVELKQRIRDLEAGKG